MIQPLERVSPQAVKFECDCSVYSADVVAKVLYWLMGEFHIYQQSVLPNSLSVKLEKKQGPLTDAEVEALQDRLNLDLNDYRLRKIIREETREIRAILYVKAFAPYDSDALFEEEE